MKNSSIARPLFTKQTSNDRWYKDVCAPGGGSAKKHCELLWDKYRPFARKGFESSLRDNFHATYWEMLLAVSLIDKGYSPISLDHGPDVGIEVDGRCVWFECAAPGCGYHGSADRVIDLHEISTAGVFETYFPDDSIRLRELSVIREKLIGGQRAGWLREGIVSPDDAYIVAVNLGYIGFVRMMLNGVIGIPRVIRAAVPLGEERITLDINGAVVDRRFVEVPVINKKNGEPVSPGVFVSEAGKSLSGLLYSTMTAWDAENKKTCDFEFVANPLASVTLPPELRIPGKSYSCTLVEGELQVDLSQPHR